jgi:exopolysaccharide biosynthesis predicted pyruvyltransferase EpsI
MNSKNKIKELKTLIHKSLKPLINSNYIFLDLPYYTNIGDTLIWKGTEGLLKTIPYKCLYRASLETYQSPKIKKNVVILLQGGGNFGDLYRPHNEFRLRVIKDFPDNPIIILPQTVYYKNPEILNEDAIKFGAHSNLTICARDQVTLEFLNKKFSKNKIILVPDMAFCIPETFLDLYKKTEGNKILFLKRRDPEFQESTQTDLLKGDVEIDQLDWPPLINQIDEHVNLHRLIKIKRRLCKIYILEKMCNSIINWYAINIYLPKLLKIGIEFISPYKYIYSTRLHGAILSVLLNKKISFLDNSYGKNSNYYSTWLENLDEMTMIGNPKSEKKSMLL